MTETPPIAIQEPVAPRRLTRVRSGRMFGGVAAGLGDYFDISPTIYRLAFAALALAGGTGVLLYVAAWLVMPGEGEDASIAERALRERRDRPGLAVGVGLLTVGLIVAVSHASAWPHAGNLWLAALLIGGGLVWWELHGPRGAAAFAAGRGPRRDPPVSLFGPVVGVLVAAAGVLGLLAALGVGLFDLRIALAAAVVLVGLAIAAGAATGRTVAGLVGLAILLLAALVVAVTVHVPFRGYAGDRALAPTTVATTAYRTAVGDLDLDLRKVPFPEGSTRIVASLGAGELHVTVPHDVDVRVDARTHLGDISVLGTDDKCCPAHARVEDKVAGATKTVVLHAEVGLGDIHVDRG